MGSLQGIQLLHRDRSLVAEQHNEDREADCRFCCRNRQYEENENLAGLVAQVARERYEVKVHGQQHEFDAHQEKNQVAAIDDDARNTQNKEHGGQRQVVLEADHCFFSASILTIRTLSLARTAT